MALVILTPLIGGAIHCTLVLLTLTHCYKREMSGGYIKLIYWSDLSGSRKSRVSDTDYRRLDYIYISASKVQLDTSTI